MKNREIIGIFRNGYVTEHNNIENKVYIYPDCQNGAKNNDIVICGTGSSGEFQIFKVIDDIKSKSKSIVTEILERYNVDMGVNDKVLKNISKLSNELSENDRKNRIDLTDKIIFTIDGEDTKDMDDAISIEVVDGKYVLGVHIADVSHYVLEDTLLDKLAEERGCSIYMVDNVIPMLPKKLSDNLCSLSPNQERLTISVIMVIDRQGKIENYQILKSIIKSQAKLTYTEVSDFLEHGDLEFISKYKELIEPLKYMKELTMILKKQRENNGCINLECKKSRVIFDGIKVSNIIEYKRRIAHFIIEEFMLICNETIAKHLQHNNIPSIYRVHEPIKKDKLKALYEYVISIGGEVGSSDELLEPSKIQEILLKNKNKEQYYKLNLMVLKSMQQARYSSICLGHFGLAKKYYCHFTSPIRRYPDLLVHRILKETLEDNNISIKRRDELEKKIETVSKSSSNMEKRAHFIEEECLLIKHIEFLSNNLGKDYAATVINIEDNKIYVMLENSIVGVLHEDVNHENKLNIGQYIRVKVFKANIRNRTLEFIIK